MNAKVPSFTELNDNLLMNHNQVEKKNRKKESEIKKLKWKKRNNEKFIKKVMKMLSTKKQQLPSYDMAKYP